jgi:hypothetical protein
MNPPARPALVVGIDTESDNQWDAEARRSPTFANIGALDRLHDEFAAESVRPTYLVTYPVARDAGSARMLRRLLARGDCEIGAHHHAWETPPFEPADVDRHLYALSLPTPRFESQLQALTDAIADATGRPPTSYRSGRFGFAASHVWGLEQRGYRVDSSVTPLFYEAHKGGPDFVDAPLTPYYLAYDSATRPGTSRVLELPVSAALNRRVPEWLARAYARAPRPYMTKRLLRVARVAHMRWLRPSYSSVEEMIALARQILARGVPMLNVIFHSSEALVGGSPYNRTDAELAAFLARLRRFCRVATTELGAVPMTMTEFERAYTAKPRPAGAPARADTGSVGRVP